MLTSERARMLRAMQPDTPKTPAAERFWQKVDKNGPIPACRPDLGACWLWTGALTRKGYGHMVLDKPKMVRAPRFAYELMVGPIPFGLQIDHLCRNHRCVNPTHLEPVTNRENQLRGMAGQRSRERGTAKTHCQRGHQFTPENTYRDRQGWRSCRRCHAEREALRKRTIPAPGRTP